MPVKLPAGRSRASAKRKRNAPFTNAGLCLCGNAGPFARKRDAALARLKCFIARRTLLDVTLPLDEAVARANELSRAHTEGMGARAIDLFQVANALILESAVLLTFDHRQAQPAKEEGLKVVMTAGQD